jgi:SAM-dependent methyltransferase
MYCPVCARTNITFQSYNGRKNAKCSNCESKERHRLMALVLLELRFGPRRKVQKVLHGGQSEAELRKWMRRRGRDAFKFLKWMDLRNIDHGDNSIHWIMHNHVMEHIKEDRKAFAEQYRVLRPNHYLLFTVPIPRVDGEYVQETVEFDRKLTAAERKKHYGQEDHERYYGFQDVMDKLDDVGFHTGFLTARDVGADETHGIPMSMGCFVSRKPGDR